MDSAERRDRRTSADRVSSTLLAPAVLASLAMMVACSDGGVVTPTTPTAFTTAAIPSMPEPGSDTGSISMVSSIPLFGTSLAVRDCQVGAVSRRCADGWRGSFEVSFSRDIVWPVLTIGFYDGDVLCGYAADVQPQMAAGEIATFSPTLIFLSDEFGRFPTPCALPARITRMNALLWTDADWSIELRQELTGHYIFSQP